LKGIFPETKNFSICSSRISLVILFEGQVAVRVVPFE
jgi:hypothetical protein